MSRRAISGKKVALTSAMIVLMGLAPITVSSAWSGGGWWQWDRWSRRRSVYFRSRDSQVETVGVGAYWNSRCSSVVTSIDWGNIDSGSSKDFRVFIRNEGDVDITLYLDTTNWDPETASDYITLSWDYGGQSIKPDEVVQATLTLSVSPSIDGITTFSFDSLITASG